MGITTSKGTIQGYNGLASVDKKHQIIIDAQVFGSGQEQHTLKPILTTISNRYKRLKMSDDIYKDGIVVTADTGFANEANMEYLHQQNINAYIPDNQFRSRDPKFKDQKIKYGKRHQNDKKPNKQFVAKEFDFDPINKTCSCPMGEAMWLKTDKVNNLGHHKLHFEGRITRCRPCPQIARCMRKPEAAQKSTGHGRQVSFIINKGGKKG